MFLTSSVWLNSRGIFPGPQWGVSSKSFWNPLFAPQFYCWKHTFSCCLDPWVIWKPTTYLTWSSLRNLKEKGAAVPLLCVTLSLILLVFLQLFPLTLLLQCFLYWPAWSCWSSAVRLFPVNYSASAPPDGAFLYRSHIALLNIFMINNSEQHSKLKTFIPRQIRALVYWNVL